MNEGLVNTSLGVIGFVLTGLVAMTAYFLMRLISQLDKTTSTVQDLSISFQQIERLKNDMERVKKKLELD